METKDFVEDFEQPSKTIEDEKKGEGRFIPFNEIPPPPGE